MPSIEDLDQFKNLINNLSNEVKWRADHGEELENVSPPPKTAAPPDTAAAAEEPSDEFLPEDSEEIREEATAAPEDVPADEEPELAADGNGNESFAVPDDSIPEIPENIFDADDSIDVPEFSDEQAAEDEAGEAEEPDFNFDDIDFGDDLELESDTEAAEPEIDNEASEETADEDFSAGEEKADAVEEDFTVPEETAGFEEPVLDETPGDDESADTEAEQEADLDSLPDIDEAMPGLGDLSFGDDFGADAESPEPRAAGEAADEEHFLGGLSDLAAAEPDEAADEAGISAEEPEPSFSLGDFGEAFKEPEAQSANDIAVVAMDDEEHDITPEDLTFTEKQVKVMREHLNRMPRNLKLVLQDLLASPTTSPTVIYAITRKLLRHAGARSLADEVRKATGTRILIPSFYEKTTGAAFERRSRGFFYTFAAEVWPKLRSAMALIIFAALSILGIYSFIYRPVQANLYYNRGLEAIGRQEYPESVQFFKTAFEGWKLGPLSVEGWPMQRWFYRYADAYAAQKQYILAEQKYDELLVHYPRSKKAFLAYGRFETQRTNYEEADKIYESYLNSVNKQDYDILLARADNLMEWGEEDSQYFYHAREVYGTLLAQHGLSDTIQLRFLNFFIKTDNAEMIRQQAALYLLNKHRKVDAQIFANLAGWFIDNHEYEEVADILRRAYDADNTVPAVHYQLARYYDLIGERDEERAALNRARAHLENQSPYSRSQMEMSIDIYARMGMLNSKEGFIDQAEIAFTAAVKQYEDAVARRIVEPSARFGEVYKALGDLYYSSFSDYDAALIYFNKAVASSFDDDDIRYKSGYIYYNKNDYGNALDNFFKAYEFNRDNRNVLSGLATTFGLRQSYALAEGFYKDLIAKLEEERRAYAESAEMSNSDVLALGSALMRAYNNLGVVYWGLSRATGQRSYYLNLAYEAFNNSSLAWDVYVRRLGEFRPDLALSNRQAVSDETNNQVPEFYSALAPYLNENENIE
jgi:tetratricopeptide (TPR) repeat protein